MFVVLDCHYGWSVELRCWFILEEKVDAAKTSWWNWFSWGKSQTLEAADELKRHANETHEAWNARFEEAKKKAERKGADIKQRVDETEEDFRRRIAKAIEPSG